jgi:Rrf2 family protein
MLTVTTEYALRALSELSRSPRGTAVLGRDLAKTARVPAKYLSKIMLSLRNAGVVGTTRGLGGGYRLLRAPEHVHLVDVVRIFEGASSKPTCLMDSARKCSEAHPCAAHPGFHDVQTAYHSFLRDTTLSDLVQNGKAHATLEKLAKTN